MAKTAARFEKAWTVRASILLATVLTLLAAGPAPAQDAAIDASPITTAAPPPQPAPSPDATPAPPEPAPSPPPADTGVIAARPLDTLDLFSAGRETGLGTDLWKGSSAAIAREVIPTLDTAPLSPAGAALAREMMATAATAPDGAGNDAGLAAARIKALLDLGDADGAGMILAHTPGISESGALSQAAAEAALITDQPDKACAVADALSVDRDGVYWLRLRAFCQVRAGKPELAQLTLTLANQQAPDPIFGRLMGAAIAGGGNPGAPSLRNGLDYALSTELKLDLTPALPHAAPPIARHLAALVPPPPPPAPGVTALAGGPPPADAAAAVPPPAPASVLTSEADVLSMLRGPSDYAGYFIVAKTAQPSIAGLVESKVPLASPIPLATAAILAGDLADAEAIRASLVQDAIPGAGPGDLAILDAMLAAARGKHDRLLLDRLVELSGQNGGVVRQRVQAAAAYLYALGTPMGPDARAGFADFAIAASKRPVARLLALDDAAEAGRKGETALLALSVAAAGGAGGPATADRADIIRALAHAGFGADAQAFAVEGLAQLQAR